MLGLQPLHIVFILVVALLIFGPARFADIGRSFGRSVREFREETSGKTEEGQETETKLAGSSKEDSGKA